MGCYDLNTYLLPLTQELSLLLQDLLVKLGVEQEAAAFPLHHRAAETTEALLEATLSDSQLKEETLRRLVTRPTSAQHIARRCTRATQTSFKIYMDTLFSKANIFLFFFFINI